MTTTAPPDFASEPDAFLAGYLQGASTASDSALTGDLETYRSLFAEAARRLTRPTPIAARNLT